MKATEVASKGNKESCKQLHSSETNPKMVTEFIQSEEAPLHVASVLAEVLKGLAHADPTVISELLHGIVGATVPKNDLAAMEPVVNFSMSLKALRGRIDCGEATANTMLLTEASDKLEQILLRAGEATQRVLSLIKGQEETLMQVERLILGLEGQLKHGGITQDTLQRELLECRALSETIKGIGNSLVYTQDVEDLCGFVIPKVRALLTSIDQDIRAHLEQLGIEVGKEDAQRHTELTDQWRVDQLLEEFSR
jgi:hypothetical protein